MGESTLAPLTLPDMVVHKAETKPEALCFHDSVGDEWLGRTHRDFHRDVVSLARALRSHGVRRSDRVAIISRPRYEWEVADKAIMWLGAITVGLDGKCAASDLSVMLEQAAPTVLFVEDAATLALVEEVSSSVELVIFFDQVQRDLAGRRTDVLQRLVDENSSSDRLEAPQAAPDDLAVIIFTSGTTGTPKGIALTHRQLTANLTLMEQLFQRELGGGLRTLAWVPLHNGTGRVMGTVNYWLDVEQYFIGDPATMFAVIKQVKPHFLVVVPRILEKVQGFIEGELAARPTSQRLVCVGLLGLRRRVPWKSVRAFCDRLLVAKLRAAVFGEALRFLISGSAPIGTSTLRLFDSMGVPTYEVYGLSEISVLVAVNRPGRQRYGSVGEPTANMELRLASDGELLVRTEAAITHYWGDDRPLCDEQGFFPTGDLAELRGGYVYLVGRKKEIIKTSTGLRLSPAAIERVYQQAKGVDQIMVIGDGRKFLTALVTVTPEVRSELEQQGADVYEQVQTELKRVEAELAPKQRIARFALLDSAFSVEAHEITPTLKLRRNEIERRHREVIEGLYGAQP